MRFLIIGFLTSIIASPLTEAINPAIYTPHTQYRKVQHSHSERIIKIQSNERFVRKIPRHIQQTQHSLNAKRRVYEVVDVEFVEGQRVGTPGTRDLTTSTTDPLAEVPVFGNDYGGRRDQRILTSRERREIILGDRKNPNLIRLVKKQNSEETSEQDPGEDILWYGTKFKKRIPAKPGSGEDPDPVIAREIIPEGVAAEGKVPNAAEMTISVVNKTQGHVDATSVEAVKGDKLKFTIDFISKEEGVHNFSAMVDVTTLLNRVYFTEIDRGYQKDNHIVFNPFTLKGPVKRTYTFEALFHRCPKESKYLTVIAHESTVNIPTVCPGSNEEIKTEEKKVTPANTISSKTETSTQSQKTVSLSATNISEGNKDAEVVGIGPGDAFRVQLTAESKSEDITKYAPEINIEKIKNQIEVVDISHGRLQGNKIIFNEFSHEAPWKQPFSFFGRLPGCKENLSELEISTEGKTLFIPTNCK